MRPHRDDSRTVSDLGVISRDLRVLLADTVRWLADQGQLRVARAAGGSSGGRPGPGPPRRALIGRFSCHVRAHIAATTGGGSLIRCLCWTTRSLRF